MRYLLNLGSCFFMFALASCDVAPWNYDIGDGLVLVQTPPQYKTIVDNTRCQQLLDAIERGETPVASEARTETVIVQDGSFEVVVTPVKYDKNGTVRTSAKVRLRRIPAVSKQVSYPAVKTPSIEEQLKSSARCRPITRRVIWTPATYKIKDKSGATIRDFQTAEALAEYINSN